MISFSDLRDWATEAEKIGELKVINGADPLYEMGAIVELNSKNRGPAIMFDNIKGYPPGYRVMTNTMSNIKTFNMTFGLPPGNGIGETVAVLKGKIGQWETEAGRFPYSIVTSAPILENVVKGDEIDLGRLPTVTWHELDRGPYIGTGGGVVTRDPDTGEINMGTYRCQLHDQRTVGFYMSPGKHGRLHRDKYFARGEPCPVAMIFGFDPLFFAAAATDISGDEFSYLGAIRREQVPVIIGRTTGLPIPAHAEVAIEGFSHPQDTLLEGPFGEWTGSYGSQPRQEPFLRPDTLYYRNNPIMLGSPPAKGVNCEGTFFSALWRSAIMWHQLEQSGLPNIRGVWRPEVGGARQLVIVAIKQAFEGHAAAVGHVAAQIRAGAYMGKYVVVVDDDINPYDMDDVLWAICTRSDPRESDLIKRAWSGPLDPRIRPGTGAYANSRSIIYAVKPYEWFADFPKTVAVSEGLRTETLHKWGGVFGDRWQRGTG